LSTGWVSTRELLILHQQLLAALDEIGVDGDTADRAELHTLRLIKVAHAFRAAVRVNLIDFCAHRDRLIRALWLADITVDAFVGDPQRHD
jgi:hypothetical protein